MMESSVQPTKQTHTFVYYDCAKHSLKAAEDAAGRLDLCKEELTLRHSSPTISAKGRLIHNAALYEFRVREHSIATAIVFSAFTLECPINRILADKLSDFYANGLDKLDLSRKWVVGL